MALFRRNKTWWTDFSLNGTRYRQSLETRDWREALSREKELIAKAEQGKLAASSQSFARLAFAEALKRYLEERKARVGLRSQKSEAGHAKPLGEYFASTAVARISAEGILAYIRQRKEKGISNTTVNMEVGILRRVLKRAKRWATVADEIPHLPERRDIGRALTHEEKVRLLKAAASKPEWEIARLAMILALNTTMRGCEIRGLEWRDIDFMSRTLTIRRSKTAAGERVIPLNAEAWDVILRLRERAIVLFGETRPDWYVFPSGEGQGPVIGSNRATVKPDPTRPMSTWRTAWRQLTRAAGLRGLRFHDMRHHAITELAESQASERTIMSIAGHVSVKMLEHYSHVRLEAKRVALEAISDSRLGGGLGGSYGTNHDTKSGPVAEPMPQVFPNDGGDDGTRTRDLCRDRAAF